MQNESELIKLLDQVKRAMILSSQTAGTGGQWERGKYLFQCASDIDAMIAGLQRNGSNAAFTRPGSSATPAVRPMKLPHFFIDGNKLAKIGPSRDGTTYQHNVVREHYDLMIKQLETLARDSKTFETLDFLSRCDIPKHEPLIILGVLEERGLLASVRRGRWSFVEPARFAADAQTVWNALPHGR
jgi:hypothetical protein